MKKAVYVYAVGMASVSGALKAMASVFCQKQFFNAMCHAWVMANVLLRLGESLV